MPIRYIRCDVNGGPGMARQIGFDANFNTKPSCDYVMFVDADDMLYPRAVDVLYTEAKKKGADVVKSKIFVEQESGIGYEIENDKNLTWCHGTIYRSEYLRANGIKFLDGLRHNEDSYFNLVCALLTDNRYCVNETTYLWRNNQNSLTRSDKQFIYTHNIEYLESQVEAFLKIAQAGRGEKLGATLANIYGAYELEFLKEPSHLEKINELVDKIFCWQGTPLLFKDASFMLSILGRITQGRVYGNDLVFYPHSFNSWCAFFGIKLGIGGE